MRAKKRHPSFAAFLILAIGLPGFIGILVVRAKTITYGPEGLLPRVQVANTSTSTPTFTPTNPPPASLTAAGLPVIDLTSPPIAITLSLHAFIRAPSGTVARPYVILTAFASIPRTGSVGIRGVMDSQEFICPTTPCILYLQPGSIRFVFQAFSDLGETSEEVIASVNVTQVENGYLVVLESVSQFTVFTDSCSQVWGLQSEQEVRWDDFVQFPYQLNTRKTLHYLATQLLLTGIVDASDCPAGGLSIGLDWPTACGLERAASEMIEWQNQYDDYIWLVSRDDGIPPKILKTLIEVESQFWPGNQRFYLDEYGLGQVSQLGMDVLLRRDPALYQRFCAAVLADCTRSYVSLDPTQQAMIRGAVLSSMDATCPTCPYGLDLNKAKESVLLIGKLLEANCQQVEAILDQVVLPDPDADAATATAAVATVAAGGSSGGTTYEDMWRFTLSSYHNGSSCLQEAIRTVRRAHLPITWENVSQELSCRGGADYVDGFMANLFSFDLYLYEPSDADILLAQATIVPTRTPVPTPTVFVSSAQVRVQVFMDRNGNNLPDEGEWIDAMRVQLSTSTNQQFEQRTQNGIAIFDMSGFTPGIGITVSLPGLYRSESFELPEQGEVT
ncbi:MAG TPA: hypothetical protein VFO91_10210, partial [Anaerolineales bacterium]|nr:hypothetical protein [Anaerolineales bacterium]